MSEHRTVDKRHFTQERKYDQGLFRCADCHGNKKTAGRKLVMRHGLKAWVCSDCIRPADREAKRT